ncbi:hypothetical protein MPSEU_000375300 [Mayamaea pseudoterrestris]|nr:hypothetical protein MPSEU_000375300 [Mayamaea pseudoterrestris]
MTFVLLETESLILTTCAFVGAVQVATVALQIVVAFFKFFLRPPKTLKRLGQWGVVTGATDGIGKAYAFAFAKQGMNVVLISRTEAKLNEVREEIKKRYANIEVKIVVCDYSNFDDEAKANVTKVLDSMEVGVLVNNVGVGYRYPQYFDELSNQEVKDLLTMNIDSTVWMTRIVLPGMLSRRKGAIVNLSSGSALYTLPLLAEYSGAKSFIEKFSRALNAEYRNRGVTCQCQIPFYVATKLAKMRKSLMVPTPEAYVRMAIKWVGYPDSLVQPFWLHALQGWILSQLPGFVVAKCIMSMHLATRSKGKKKDAKLASEGKEK